MTAPWQPPMSNEARAAALAHARRSDFYFFFLKAVTCLNIGKLVPNWSLEAMCAYAQRLVDGDLRRGMVNVPPRSLKTVIFSSILPAYLLGIDPTRKIICVSHTREVAEKFAYGTRAIMRSDWYRELFPATRLDKVALGELVTTQGGFRLTTSVDGGVTGRGGDIVIVDDPLQADDAESDTRRTAANDWVRSTLMSRFDNPKVSQMVIVAQRLHQDDLCANLMETGDWDPLVIPLMEVKPTRYRLMRGGVYDRAEGELLCPALIDEAEMAAIRASMGSRRFLAQYQQEPTPADGEIFKREWLRIAPQAYQRQPGDQIVQSWDMAVKAGDRHDWSVCITAVVRRRQVIIIDVLRKRLEFPALKQAVIAQARAFKPLRLYIEDAAAGAQMIQMLRDEQPRGMPLPIAIKPVTSKIDRALIAAARCEAGELLLDPDLVGADVLIEELVAFPAGRHDDQVDALAHLMANTQARILPPLVSPSFGYDEIPDDPDIATGDL